MTTETKITDGGPAFPVVTGPYEDGSGYGHWEGQDRWQFGGLTMRDYFAAHCPITLAQAAEKYEQNHGPGNVGQVLDYFSDLRWAYADAMLAAREAK